MIKNEKSTSNVFSQEVFANSLFGKVVDKELSRKFELFGSKQRKRNIPKKLNFVDLQ